MFSPRNSRNIHKVVSWHEAVGTLCGCLAVLGFLIFSVSFHFKTFILWTHRQNSHIVMYFWKTVEAMANWKGMMFRRVWLGRSILYGSIQMRKKWVAPVTYPEWPMSQSPSRPEPIELSSKVHPVCRYASVPDKMEMGRCTPSNGNCCSKIRDAFWNEQ